VSGRERERVERLVRAVAQDRREVMAALDEIESAALETVNQTVNLKRRIAESPQKWLMLAAGVGLLFGLRGSGSGRMA
jgi:hypothetical protein